MLHEQWLMKPGNQLGHQFDVHDLENNYRTDGPINPGSVVRYRKKKPGE